jgi:glycerophosphoryl diester phosphodiesterase
MSRPVLRSALLALALSLGGCASLRGGGAADPPVEIVAHRGESFDAPENTLASFNLAWERGVSTIELDVHLTRDGATILSHDPNTNRATGVDRVIRQSTLAELRTLDAGRWKGERWAGEKLPTLDEVLASIPAGRRCFIEIKEGPDVVAPVAAAIERSGKAPGQLVIISFNAETVAEAKRRLPNIDALYLSSFRRDSVTGAWSPTVDELIQTARRIRADGLDLSITGPVDAAFVQRVKGAGLQMHVWTIDDPAVARRMVAAGVDGITTNRAAWMRGQLARPAGE